MPFKKMKETPEELVRRLMKNQHIPEFFYEKLVELAYRYIELCNTLSIKRDAQDLYWSLSDSYRDAMMDITRSVKYIQTMRKC